MSSQSSYAFQPSDLQKLKSTGSCQKCDLSGADLTNIKLKNADLSGANLANANLTNAQIIDSDLRSVNFTGATLVNTNVYGTQIAISPLTKTQYAGLIFKKPDDVVAQPVKPTPTPIQKTGITPRPTPAANPIEDSYVSLRNESGYVAKYTLVYMTNQNFGGNIVPIPKTETGNLTLGFTKKLVIPKDAKNIVFRVQVVGNGSSVIDKALPVGRSTCFKVYGTVFNPKQAENNCSSF